MKLSAWAHSLFIIAIVISVLSSFIMPIGAQNIQSGNSNPIVNASDYGQSIQARQSSDTANAQALSSAPLNPEFIKYQESLNNTLSSESYVSSYMINEHTLGLIPEPIDFSYLKGEQIIPNNNIHALLQAQTAYYPLSYDLRSLRGVTPIKDQGSSGSCWAFATYGSLESYLLKNENEIWDFSENNLKNTAGFDVGPNSGGNNLMSTAYLTRWSGPVAEQDDPYNPTSTWSPTNLPVQQHVQDVLYIPNRINSTDNDNIKWAIMTYGAVYTSMEATSGMEGSYTDNYYNAMTHSYFYNGAPGGNHAVAIVGWDDNYNKNNFSTTPPGNGAFIIKNSWGTSWGDHGYFYVSYYDVNIGSDNAVFTSEPTSNYDNIYQYDPQGWTTSYGYSSSTAWFANVFTANGNQLLTSIGFYAAEANSQYTIYIYNGNMTNKNFIKSQSGSIPVPGYHTINLNQSILLSAGQSFCIEVNLTTPGYNYPIPIEQPQSGYSSKAKANASESWVSPNGQSWTDITTVYGLRNTNVCLKAYTQNIVGINPSSLDITEGYSGNYSIVLRSQPSSNVVVNILNDSLLNVNVSSVVFDRSDWNIPQYVAVTAVDDHVVGYNRTDVIAHSVSSSDPYFNSIPVPNLTVNVADNDTTPQSYLLFNGTVYSVNENAGTVAVNVTRLGDTSMCASVNYTTGYGNATPGQNYASRSGILYFLSGDTNKTITVPIIDDGLFDTQKCFNITLSNATNVSLGAMAATVYMKNIDPAPVFNFSATTFNANWSDNNATLTITKTGQTALTSSVRYTATNGDALAGTDYVAANGVITFQPGDTSRLLNISLLHNTNATGNRSFNITLSSPSNATLGTPGTAMVNITRSTYQYIYTLVPGWNLISIPVNIIDNNIDDFFPANVKNGIVDVWGWNETKQDFMFYSLKKNDWYYSQYEPLNMIETGRSYWVEMNKTASFTIVGTMPVSYPLGSQSLVNGWNFRGITGISSYSVDSLYSNPIDIWGWNETNQDFMFYSLNKNDWYYTQYESLNTINPGHGYWIEMP